MKNFILLVLLLFVIIAVCQPVKKLVINACESVICLQDTGGINTNITSIGEHRHRRTLKPTPPTCSINQYFDEDEGRCLGVVGGGKVLYINNKISCGTNTLKPHCTNPRYYYICKKNKTILVQCTHGKHFENRLKKCVHVPDDVYVSVTVDPKMETVSFFQLPDCNKPGSFPVPGDCAQFYTCETNGHRMHQNFFRCPKNMAYDIDTEMCTPSNNCEGSEDLPSMCAWSTSKEKLTLEEAEKWLNIWPLNDTRLINSDVKISKNFTLNENGSVTICETIFAIGEKNATTTNIYETSATTQSTNDVVTTVVSYMKPPTSAFVEVSDHSDVATSTKRDKETSRSSNTDDSASTKAYSARTDEPTVMKDIKLPSEVGDDELSLETTTFGEPVLKEKMIELPTVEMSTSEISTDKSIKVGDDAILANQSIPSTTEKEIEAITKANINDPLPDITTLAESILQEQYSTTEKDIESSSSEIRNIHDDPTIVAKEGMSSTTKMDAQTAETSTDWPFLETTTLGEPPLEGQYSTSGPQKSPDPSPFILADPTVSTNQEIPDTTEKEIEGITKANINDPLPDITTLAESILQEQYSTTEKDIESSSSKIRNIPDDPTIVAKEEMSSTTKMDAQTTETSTDWPFLETTTLGEPLLERQYSTSAAQKSPDPSSFILADPTVSTNQEIPDTTEKEIEGITKANINDPLPDITTLAESILQEQYSTTEKDIESSSSEIRNIHDDPTIVAKEGMSSTTKMDAQTAETSTDWPFLETTTLGEPPLEGQYSTSGPQKSPDPSPFILADPTVSTNQEIPDTTEKEIEGITKANINDPLPDITTLAESILQEQYSTTEKDIESSSSKIRNIPDDPTIVAKEEMSSTTKMDAQTTETSTDWPFLETTTLGEPLLEGQYSTSAAQKSPDPSSFILADPTVSTNQEIPDTTEKEIEGITKANINDPLPDITTLAESILQEQYSTTEKDIESSSSKIRNIPDDPTIVAKEEMSSTTKMDAQTTETSTDWPFLETTTLGEPLLEGQYSTSAAQKSPDPSSFILADPTVSTSKEIPDTTEKEIEGITKADINDPLPDITTLAESILQEQYSTTEKDIESSSSEIRNIHDDPTIFANQSIFSSTDTNAQNTTTVSTESVSSSTDAAHYVDVMSTTSSPKNVHEFNTTSVNIGQMENLIPTLNNVPLTKAIFVVNNISSSTISPNLKTTNETVIDNAVSTLNVVSTTESTFLVNETSESTTYSTLSDSKTIKSISSESEPLPIMKPITSPGELIANCKTLYAANNSLTSIQSDATSTGKSSNSTDNETYSKSFDRQQHSHVTDKNKTKKDVAGKGTEIAPEMKYSGRTISKHIVLPIASAVLNITDRIERRWRYRIRNLLLKHTSKHLTRM